MLWSSSSGRSILIADFSTLTGMRGAFGCSSESSFSLQNARLADGGVVKNWKSKKGCELGNFFFLVQMVFGGGWFETFLNLKGCVFLYVPMIAGRKISVKGALGVGGGGEEWLKTYTCVRTGGGIVL